MPLTHIEYGSLASSSVVNNNFEYLDDRITSIANNLVSTSAGMQSGLSNLNNSLNAQTESLSSDISDLQESLTALQNAFNSHNNAPDYSKGIVISMPYTAETDGYVYAGVDGKDCMRYVYVNEKKVHGHSGSSSNYQVYSASLFRVSPGDFVTVDRLKGAYYFYPMKGDN